MNNTPIPEFDEDGEPSHLFWGSGPWWARTYHMEINLKNKDVKNRIQEHFEILSKIKVGDNK